MNFPNPLPNEPGIYVSLSNFPFCAHKRHREMTDNFDATPRQKIFDWTGAEAKMISKG